MKISDITTEFVENYLRIDDASEIEEAEIGMMMDAAKSRIIAETGLTQEQINEHDDMVHPYLLIISDMFDNRNGHLDSKNTTPNESIRETLKRYAVNYL